MNTTVAFLIIMTTTFGGFPQYDLAPMPDMATCEKVLAASKIAISPGDENEATLMAFCGIERPDRQIDFNIRQQALAEAK